MEPEAPCLQIKTKKIDERLNVMPVRTVLFFLVGTILAAIIIELLPPNASLLNSTLSNNKYQPTYAIYGKSDTDDHLVHVKNILKLFGYKQVDINGDWNLLWAHDYPYFNLKTQMQNLRSHQIVNHFPGCGFLTNKVDLSTSKLPNLPRAFRLPQDKEEFIQYSIQNPEALFVEKHNEHRQIFIKSPSNILLNSTDKFVQEFIGNPFLVDGYKFDIGVYVLITSIDPLRIYIYTGDVLFRYCAVKYHPFDPSNVEKYVVGDDYLPTWEIPSLIKYYNKFGGSMRGAFDAYMQDQFLDSTNIWKQVEDIIRDTIIAKESDISRIMRSYKTHNFFDLMRFDLIIDDKLRVHLMEANMSPNLSSAHFKPNSLLYEQILYSALNLVGLGSPIRQSTSHITSTESEEIITADKNLATNLNMCVEYNCDKNCNRVECNLCLPCMSGTDYNILEKAHREHLHRTDMKRIFPKPIENVKRFDLKEETRNLTAKNKWMAQWFFNKCSYDRSWCF